MVGITMLALFFLGIAIAALGHPGFYRIVFGGSSRTNDHNAWLE